MLNQHWVDEELGAANFGDKRLNKRFIAMAKKFDQSPEQSIPKAFVDWSQVKATYRFFENEQVSAQKIHEPHFQQTLDRLKSRETVLIIQDTTFFLYSHYPKTTGLGKVGKAVGKRKDFENQGLIMHTSFAIDPSGLPLGILNQKIFARSENSLKTTQLPANVKRKLPIEYKESSKWIEPIEWISLLTPDTFKGKLVHVADREADFFEFFWKAKTEGAHILIRASHNRNIDSKSRINTKQFQNTQLFEKALKQPQLGCIEIEVEADSKKQRSARTATLGIRTGDFTLWPERHHYAAQCVPAPQLPLWFVYVLEENPPFQEEPLEWLLITNLPTDDLNSAIEKVRWYEKRFQIETFHKILKSGFQVESQRMSTAEKLTKYLSFMSILAWKILWMTWIARVEPQKSASEILLYSEYKVIRQYFNINTDRDLTVAEAIRLIARLGGFLNRKGDGDPGPIVLWRGWNRLSDLNTGWNLKYSNQTYG
jgi:hypothetical protein